MANRIDWVLDEYDVVAQDTAPGLLQPPLHATQPHVFLHPADPEHAALGQQQQMLVVDVGHVKYHDFACSEARA